jgi:hypothetical protein
VREEHRPGVFEGRVCGAKGVEVTGGSRKQHKEELCGLCEMLLWSQMKENEMGRACGTYGAKKTEC